jgi:hypothetical protein
MYTGEGRSEKVSEREVRGERERQRETERDRGKTDREETAKCVWDIPECFQMCKPKAGFIEELVNAL